MQMGRAMEWLTFGKVPHLHYEGTIIAREPELIIGELSQFWYRVLMATMEAYPDADWEGIACRLWANSGRFITYPYQAGQLFQRHERVFIQVHVEDREERYWPFIYDPDVDDADTIAQYDRETDNLVQQYWNWLVEASQREPAVSSIYDMRQRRSLTVCAGEEHLIDKEDVFVLPI